MVDHSLRSLTHQHMETILHHNEEAIIMAVKRAYESHRAGESSLPHSSFLLFPQQPKNRIIALPAYLGGTTNLAGIKWIASFPDNHTLGLDRASAVIIVNSMETGRPLAILEGSIISKQRTAASAALAARYLHKDGQSKILGLIGTGVINFEILRFLRIVYPSLCQVVLYDLSIQRAEEFQLRCHHYDAELEVIIVSSYEDVFRKASLVSIATTSPQPYIHQLPDDHMTQTILHISLRDLAPEIILQATNVVDDIDHVARAQTSIHLTEQQAGHRDFIYSTLADITSNRVPRPADEQSLIIFSPFGLGVLDLAVSNIVLEQALREDVGYNIPSFLPEM